jgi:nucleotide-binding universal stress UspA family protein
MWHRHAFKERAMYRHILVPTDGSALSHKAAKAAIAFAKKVGARVTAYHALEIIPTYLGAESALMDPNIIEIIETTARKRAEKDVAKIAAAARSAGVACTTYITRPVTAYEGIIRAAKQKKCDAIFIASHGRGGVGSLILGSVTQRVLAHSKIPVLVYR